MRGPVPCGPLRQFEKSEKFALYPTVDNKFFTYEELFNKIKAKQTDKDEKLIILYASDKQAQHSYIENAKNKGYEVLLLDSPIVSHLIQKLESSKEKIQFARVDSDHIDNLIDKNENKDKFCSPTVVRMEKTAVIFR